MSKLPNILTISRIVLLPVLIILIFSDSNLTNFLSIVLFIMMSITDYLDGLIARKTKNTSNFGKMLDPIADKLFVVLILIAFISDSMLLGIHLIPAYLIIAREIFISGLREYASSDDNKKEIPVSNPSKDPLKENNKKNDDKTLQELDREKLDEKFSKEDKEKLN